MNMGYRKKGKYLPHTANISPFFYSYMKAIPYIPAILRNYIVGTVFAIYL